MRIDWGVVEVERVFDLGFWEKRLGVDVVEGEDLGFWGLKDLVD